MMIDRIDRVAVRGKTYQINRVDVRAKLEPRREPYWVLVAEGRFLGFRKLSAASPGNWVSRYYLGDRKYKIEKLGVFKNFPEKERFDRARLAAEEKFKHLDQGGSTKAMTVEAACRDYVDELKTENSEDASLDAEGRFRRLVYGDPDPSNKIEADPIAKVDLAKLTAIQVNAWKKRVLNRGGTKGSCNRNMTALRAALNLALKRRVVSSNHAWISELAPFEKADGKRTVTLTRSERRRLIEKSSTEAQPLIRAMALLPLRPGDIAKLKVSHFDVRRRILSVPAGKTKPREIPLSGEALAHVKAGVTGKLPAAWIFCRADGSQWDRFAWREVVNDAAAAAKLPAAVCAYTLRHSAINDLMVSGLDLFHVAKMAGTSVKMIEENYGHVRDDEMRKGFAVLSLKK